MGAQIYPAENNFITHINNEIRDYFTAKVISHN